MTENLYEARGEIMVMGSIWLFGSFFLFVMERYFRAQMRAIERLAVEKRISEWDEDCPRCLKDHQVLEAAFAWYEDKPNSKVKLREAVALRLGVKRMSDPPATKATLDQASQIEAIPPSTKERS